MNTDTLITSLQKKIESSDTTHTTGTYGIVQSVSAGIARVSGLADCMSSEMLTFESGMTGIALNLEADTIGVILLGDAAVVREGEKVTRTGKVLSVGVSDDVVGRIVDPLMQPLDGKPGFTNLTEMPIEKIAPGVMDREPVSQPIQTGIMAIDALVPIGRGQRELIIGDRGTGKTAVAIDAILNQKGEDVICVYVAIGQKRSKVTRLVNELEKHGAMKYTTVVLAGASDAPSLLYLAPYAGATVAEYFMAQGKDVLVVYDDLSKHAVAYREISLLLRRPPGREAYPGDVFYLHSRLLERACRRNDEAGGGSITALPIIETQGGDNSAYIPTNVISITDGQIFLESALFHKGVRPAINVGASVSRVGGAAQIKSMKKNAGSMKLSLAQYRELESFSQFDSDLDEDTKKTLERGKRTTEVMKQPQYSPLTVSKQVAFIYAVNSGALDHLTVTEIAAWKEGFSAFLDTAKQSLLAAIAKGWGESEESELKAAITEYAAQSVA
jgi:F-type H+/Na+-transporting ATPase subunit alpha